jgi:hypothetical protein
MTTTFWAMALRPFVLFFILAVICLPVRFAVKRFLPEGRLKRLLLTDIKKSGK